MVLFGIGAMHAYAPVLASEQFPTKFRYSGGGIAYNLSAVIGGMFTPALLSELIGKDVVTKFYYIPLFYFIYFIVAVIAILKMKETKDIDLDAIDTQ